MRANTTWDSLASWTAGKSTQHVPEERGQYRPEKVSLKGKRATANKAKANSGKAAVRRKEGDFKKEGIE